jgi:hypothetical protein
MDALHRRFVNAGFQDSLFGAFSPVTTGLGAATGDA